MILHTALSEQDPHPREVVENFKTRTRFKDVAWAIKGRPDGNYLLVYLANPTERLFRALNETLESISENNPYRERTALLRRPVSPRERLLLPETQHLRTVLSESLTVTSHSFREDFFVRYIPSLFGAEEQIIADGNHIVYGRRGSGKSSLLAYLLNTLRPQNTPHAWVDMQTYAGRKDSQVIIDVLLEIVQQLSAYNPGHAEIESIKTQLNSLAKAKRDSNSQIDRVLPRTRKAIFPLTQKHERVVIFLDDLHVIDQNLQPAILAKLYSICRGNRVFLKISGIEQFTKNWDPSSRLGLETPHDAQVIRLDSNLTMPDKSKSHIQNILDAHANYCGLPEVNYICGNGVLSRLAWVAAGVPRDALYIFTQAIVRATVKNQKKVSITSVNEAASEMAEEKLRDIQKDISGRYDEARTLLEEVRQFCITAKRTNAFLVEIRNDNPKFNRIKELIALRLLHVLHESITPHQAGRRFMALMLDYGFYVEIRAAKSVELFQKEPRPFQAKELRKLPIFQLPKTKAEFV